MKGIKETVFSRVKDRSCQVQNPIDSKINKNIENKSSQCRKNRINYYFSSEKGENINLLNDGDCT